jgi:hypothetical protein
MPRGVVPVSVGRVVAPTGAPVAAPSGGLGDVDQFVLEEALVDDGQPAGRHEPTGREGG